VTLPLTVEAAGWVARLNGDHVPETKEYGVSNVVLRDAEALRTELTECLLTESEAGLNWSGAADPFPAWDVVHVHEPQCSS
jgi:hypothetical protein